MEVKIDLYYKGKTANAVVKGTNIDNCVFVKMITGLCTAMQNQLIAENGPDDQGCMNWNITWTKI